MQQWRGEQRMEFGRNEQVVGLASTIKHRGMRGARVESCGGWITVGRYICKAQGEGGEKRASSGGKAPRPDEKHIYRKTTYDKAGGPGLVSHAESKDVRD